MSRLAYFFLGSDLDWFADKRNISEEAIFVRHFSIKSDYASTSGNQNILMKTTVFIFEIVIDKEFLLVIAVKYL